MHLPAGRWELWVPRVTFLCVVLSGSHSSRKCRGRAGADSCARELPLLGWVYFGNQQYSWGGGMRIKKQGNVPRLIGQQGVRKMFPFQFAVGQYIFRASQEFLYGLYLPLKSIPVFLWDNDGLPFTLLLLRTRTNTVSYTLPIQLLLSVIVKVRERDIIWTKLNLNLCHLCCGFMSPFFLDSKR